jgi:hypothetical protein
MSASASRDDEGLERAVNIAKYLLSTLLACVQMRHGGMEALSVAEVRTRPSTCSPQYWLAQCTQSSTRGTPARSTRSCTHSCSIPFACVRTNALAHPCLCALRSVTRSEPPKWFVSVRVLGRKSHVCDVMLRVQSATIYGLVDMLGNVRSWDEVRPSSSFVRSLTAFQLMRCTQFQRLHLSVMNLQARVAGHDARVRVRSA